MNQMAGRMDTLLDAQERSGSKSHPALLDEVRLWVGVDPLLAELHKRYLDAKVNYARALNRHGEDDPMTDMAADMADSTRCAVDTRILELRHDPASKAKLQAIIRQAHIAREKEQEEQDAEEARTRRFWAGFAGEKKPRVIERAKDSFIHMLLYIMMLQAIINRAEYNLSIADAFMRASGPNRRVAASV